MRISWLVSGIDPTEDEVRDQLSGMATEHGVPDAWRAITDGEDFGFYSDGLFAKYGSLLPK